MKVGFLGGSFNPPHFGHIQLASVAKKQLGLDIVIFLVTPCNPFKSKIGLPSVKKRMQLLQNLIKNRHFKISSIEQKFKVAESFRTVNLVKAIYPDDELYFICGSDNMLHFHKWKNYQDILRDVNVVFVNRGGFDVYKTLAKSRIPKNLYQMLYYKTHAISSTDIRSK